MTNPIEIISASRARLARLALGEVALAGVLPVAATIALACSIEMIDATVWHHWGYVIQPNRGATLRRVAFLTAAVEIVAAAILAIVACRRAADFEETAQKIDELVGARQEVLTLASLADPGRPEQQGRRSALFATLWRHVIGYLETFEPRHAFRFNLVAPVQRAAGLVGVIVIAMLLAGVILIRAPRATLAAAYTLRDFANSIDLPAASPEAHQLAAAARDVARDLENPQLPPRQQLAELRAIKQEIAKLEQLQSSGQKGAGAGQGGGSGEGAGNGSDEGSGSGSGKGAQGAGEGAKKGGNGVGSGGDKSGKDGQSIRLQNNLAKAEAKLEQASGDTTEKTASAKDQGAKGSGMAPAPGNPNGAGGAGNPNGTGNVQLPENGKVAQSQAPASEGKTTAHKDDAGTQGDTHMGDFPKPVAYERFYKLGEHGPPIDIKNARYVTFRLPASVISAGGEGNLVHDTGMPTASAPYTNAPLKEEHLTAAPDEEQLLPPRYRDLIR